MATLSHESPVSVRRLPSLDLPEMWDSLAIVVMWLAVLFDAVFGPDIVSSTPGGTTSTVPSAVAVALFALLATIPIARYGFRRDR